MNFHISLTDDDGLIIVKEYTSLPEVAIKILDEAIKIYEAKKELMSSDEGRD